MPDDSFPPFEKIANRGVVENLLGRDAFARTAGLEVIAAEPGRATVRMPVRENLLNGHGNLHGGALFTLADYAAAVASNMYGDATMALDGSISFLNAVRGGSVTAVAKTVKAGRRIKFQTVDIRDDDGVLVATYQSGSISVRRKDGANEAADVREDGD